MVLVYVVLSTFLANASSDAMLHRIFTILLILSGGGEQGEHICVCVCVCTTSISLSRMSKQPGIFRQALLTKG